MPVTARDGTVYSDEQVKQAMAGKSQDELNALAQQLGIDQYQVQQAMQIAGRVPAPGTSNVAPTATQGAFTTAGGTRLTPEQIRAFLATNPTDQQIMQTAAQNGMSMSDIGLALNSQNLLFNNGDPTSIQMNDSANGSIFNRLNNLAYTGSTGFGSSDMTNPNTVLTQGARHVWSANGGGGSWIPYGQTGTSAQGGTNVAGMTPAGQALGQPAQTSAVGGALTTAANSTGATYGTPYQTGQSTATDPVRVQPAFNWGTQPAQQFNTPVLDALYATQQQRMTSKAPTFDFQDKPGALTQAIAGT